MIQAIRRTAPPQASYAKQMAMAAALALHRAQLVALVKVEPDRVVASHMLILIRTIGFYLKSGTPESLTRITENIELLEAVAAAARTK